MQLFLQANHLRHQSCFAKAVEVYKQLLQHDDSDVLLLAALAHAYFSMALTNVEETGENFQQAVDVMQHAIGLAPRDGHLHVALASFYSLGLNDYISVHVRIGW